MNLASVFLGLAGIALGANSLAKGVKTLGDGLGPPGGGGERGGVPTIIVPRSATRKMPPIVRGAVKVQTRAGKMGLELREVRTLGDRLAVIIDRANEGKVDPRIVAWARKEVSKKCRPGWNGEQWCIPEKRKDLEAIALFKAVRRDVKYLSDIAGVDTFSTSATTLRLGAEDCDGFSSLLGSALMAVGIPVRMKVIETKQSTTGADHIYNQALIDGKWIPFDASVAMGPGWEAPASMVRRAWVYETD